MRWLAEQMPAGYCFRATSNVFLVQKGRRPGTARHASVGKPRENARPSPREVRFRRYVAARERIDEGRQIPDENANDHLDTNVLGLPTEGYALSNGVRPVMSKPTFQQAAFTVGSGDKPVALHIRY